MSGSGFKNVIGGIEHFPQHIIDFLNSNGAGVLADLLKGAASELVSFEAANGPDQLKAAAAAGKAKFDEERAAGKSVGEAIIAGVAAAFIVNIPGIVSELKTLSTQAMTHLISSVTAPKAAP